MGISDKASSKDLDASVDFAQLPFTCTITLAKFVKTKQLTGDKGKKTGCEDSYEYYFTAEGLANVDAAYGDYDASYEFVSFEKVQRRDNNSCDRSDRLAPLMEAGDIVDCWRPAMPGFVPSKWYRCGNDECIKVFSPFDDVKRAQNIAASRYIGGAITTGLCAPLLLVGTCLLSWLKKKYYPNSSNSSNMGMTTSAPYGLNGGGVYATSTTQSATANVQPSTEASNVASLFDQMNGDLTGYKSKDVASA